VVQLAGCKINYLTFWLVDDIISKMNRLHGMLPYNVLRYFLLFGIVLEICKYCNFEIYIY